MRINGHELQIGLEGKSKQNTWMSVEVEERVRKVGEEYNTLNSPRSPGFVSAAASLTASIAVPTPFPYSFGRAIPVPLWGSLPASVAFPPLFPPWRW